MTTRAKAFHYALIVSAIVVCLPLAVSAEDQHPIVPGVERFHAADASSIVAGRLLMSELRCSACHDGLPADVHPRNAPLLDDVGSRIRPEALRAIISGPHLAKPGALMPEMLGSLADAERAATVEAITHFLVGNQRLVDTPPFGRVRGEKLFHEVGCVACHQSQKPGAKRLATSVPLTFVDKKYSVTSLSVFLKNPHTVRPSGRMPNLNLTDGEANAIASYLLKDLEVPSNLTFRYYEGNWQKLPDFQSLDVKASGVATGFDTKLAARRDHFGLVFEGFLQIALEGEYEFELGSDDGSRLVLDGEEVLRVDGIHPMQRKSAKRKLKAGPVEIRVEYFEGGGGEELEVKLSGPNLKKQDVAAFITSVERIPEEDEFQVQPQLVAKGRAMFAKHGCASCHQLKRANQLVGLPMKGGQIRNAGGGCLAAAPKAGVPNFHLSDTQRKQITAAVGSTGSAPKKPTIASTMKTFNCYACHLRDKIGGPERDRNAWFRTVIPEMGDEGRVPPSLDGVGDKLNDKWLRHVMDNGADDRPYMLTRMPKFGKKHVGTIAGAFAAKDRRTEVAQIEFDEPIHRVKASGRFLIGDKGLSCMKCHYFGKYKATGIQALDLQTMTKRLRRDWFHRYLTDPQAYRSGTRMPSAWPGGRVIMKNVLGGKAPTQMEGIWAYLNDGEKAAVPSGLVVGKKELKPLREVILYRNFITGLSPRGIAVGNPAKAHYAWDASDMSLALIWQGAFIDAAKHWTGRGQGTQGPLGSNQASLVRGVPIASLKSAKDAWPDQTRVAQFEGYRLDDEGAPTFSYTLGSVNVTDQTKAVKGDPFPVLHRTVTISGTRGDWYFRAAVGDSVKKLDGGTLLINDAIEMTFDGDVEGPIIRQSGGNQEVLLRLRPNTSGRSTVKQAIRW